MNILLLGSGGREHALAWKLQQSPQCTHLYVAPGNAGTAAIAENVPLPGSHDDEATFRRIARFVREKDISLLIVGPEAPLVAGIRDYFEQQADLSHVALVGPGRAGAMLEGSKDFAKAFMQRHHIPTARSRTFTQAQLKEGLIYLATTALPIVLKADGLAAGKGVIICDTLAQAQTTLEEMLLQEKFGEASRKVVIEEFLEGIELSVFVLTDGRHYHLLPEAKDYKRIGEQDTGPNTGGMGAISPVPFANEAFMQTVQEKIIRPTIDGLQQEGIRYRGFIFIGLMNVQGEPYVIEYNVRLGDPEAEVIIPRMEDDLVPLLLATANQTLDDRSISISADTAATVVMVAEGYPGHYEKGKQIKGLSNTGAALVFHAGSRAEGNAVLTDGGRVLAVTGLGKDMAEALQTSYQQVHRISWEGCYFRTDIGKDLQTWQQTGNL